ncbi:MAG: 50S ribosomal protein L25 [Candidatus Paceibacteria bacterium]
MADYTLLAQKRTVFGKKLKKARTSGKLPAILYGHGIENIPLFLDEKDFNQVLESAGRNTVILLKVLDDSGKAQDTKNVLIHEVAYDPILLKPTHADLYQIRMDEKVRVQVPLIFEGESEAVKAQGGILIKAMHSIEVEALPGNLPHEIKVDVSGLKTFEDTVYVKDLNLPKGVTILVEPNTPVASVAPPRSEEELRALEAEVPEEVKEVPPETIKEVQEEEVTQGPNV